MLRGHPLDLRPRPAAQPLRQFADVEHQVADAVDLSLQGGQRPFFKPLARPIVELEQPLGDVALAEGQVLQYSFLVVSRIARRAVELLVALAVPRPGDEALFGVGHVEVGEVESVIGHAPEGVAVVRRVPQRRRALLDCLLEHGEGGEILGG